MSQAKLQHHLKVDSNVASFGGTVTTTVSAAEGASLRHVEKNAVLTERQLDDMYKRNHLQLGGSDASLTTSGTGDSASGGSSAGSVISSGVSTDSVELLGRRQQLQQAPPPPPHQPQPPPQPRVQQQRFASLLTVDRSPASWASHAQVTFRYRSDRLYYIDSAQRLHGPMDQREQCQVATVRRHVTRSDHQPPVATRSHRTVQLQQQQAPTATFEDGLLLLDHRFTASNYGQQQQQHRQQQQQQHISSGGGGGSGVYSRVQVNQYSDEWGATMPRSYSQQLDYGGFSRQNSRDSQPQQHVQHYHRSSNYHHSNSHHRSHRGPQSPQHPPHAPAFDARLEHLERSLNQAMESIRRQTSSSSHHRSEHHHRQNQQHQQQQHQYVEQLHEHQQDSGMRRFNSEPPFEFRYSQRTMTHEPPQVTEEVETTTLQPIGRGIHDLGGGARFAMQQQSSVTEQHRVTRSSRLAVRQPQDGGGGGGTGRSLSANRSATLRASTPVSPKFQQRSAGGTLGTNASGGGGGGGGGGTVFRGRHLSANAPPPQQQHMHREFAQVY